MALDIHGDDGDGGGDTDSPDGCGCYDPDCWASVGLEPW